MDLLIFISGQRWAGKCVSYYYSYYYSNNCTIYGLGEIEKHFKWFVKLGREQIS